MCVRYNVTAVHIACSLLSLYQTVPFFLLVFGLISLTFPGGVSAMQLYRKEGIQFKEVEFSDNQPMIDLIMSKKPQVPTSSFVFS